MLTVSIHFTQFSLLLLGLKTFSLFRIFVFHEMLTSLMMTPEISMSVDVHKIGSPSVLLH